MDKIKVTIQVNRAFEIAIDPDVILDQINIMPLTQRWDYVANFISSIEVSVDELSSTNKEIVRKYLKSKLELFKG